VAGKRAADGTEWNSQAAKIRRLRQAGPFSLIEGARLESEARERVQATPTRRNARAISSFAI
jgi:hypothetical protein